MKVLVVSPTPTHPMYEGNRVRVVTLMEQLRVLGHEVHFAHVEMTPGDAPAMAGAWAGRFHPIAYHRPAPGVAWRLRRAISWRLDRGRWYYWRLDDWYDARATEALAALQQRERFDAVVVVYVFFSRALDAFGSDVLKILDTQDVMADRHLGFVSHGDRPGWYSTTRSEEARGVSRADLVLAIQESERAYFESIGAKRTLTLGPVIQVVRRRATCQAARPTVLFIGSDNYYNVSGMRDFIANVWPLVRARLDAELVVAGGVCEHLDEAEGIRMLGHVEDLDGLYENAHVVVNPVRGGTGLNIKSIEALGRGMPMVTTSSGARGLESGRAGAFLVADRPDDLARAVIRLLEEPALAAELTAAAHDFAAAWNVVQHKALSTELRRPKGCVV